MRRIQAGVVLLATAIVAAAMFFSPKGTPEADADLPCDALCTRVRAELKVFTDWLAANGATGYIGEVGWPGTTDSTSWNNLAEIWYRDADAANLWVTGWAAGEWWPNSYALNVYVNSVSEGSALDTARPQSTVVEAHPATASYRRGVNLNGGEFGAPGWSATTSSFSNANPGTYGTAWHYDTQGTFDYLARRGIKVVRLPFRWERIQPTLGGALDTNELQRLKDAAARANQAGIQVIPTVFNYGGYMLYDGTQGVRRTIGTSYVTNAHYADLWSRLSGAFKSNTAVAGYDLMNEPASMTAASGLTAAQTWEKASQAAVDAIRATGDTKLILVPGYSWSGTQVWAKTHPKAWITDSARNIRYEAHHYWDRDNSGAYKYSYADEVANAESRGYTTSILPDETTTTTSSSTTSSSTTSSTTTSSTTTSTSTTSTTTTSTTSTTLLSSGPSITITDATAAEGKNVKFTVKLSQASTAKVTVNFATLAGTALPVADFVAKTGTVTFRPGVTSKPIAVSTVDDALKEPVETFSVELALPTNATIADGTGVGTIKASD